MYIKWVARKADLIRRRWNFDSMKFSVGTSIMVGVLFTSSYLAQGDTAKSLSERSAIVLRGSVVRINASEEPLQKPSSNTVVVKVSQMYSGAEIAGDQTGRNVTVVLGGPAKFKVGTIALFFGNPRFVGKSLTISDEGEIVSTAAAATDLELGLQARRDVPVLERLANSHLVFVGKVESERPLVTKARGKEGGVLPSEHDPEWHVAAVRVVTPISGGEKGALLLVVFANSRDIMWFNSPKLNPGQTAIFVTHTFNEEHSLLERSGDLKTSLENKSAVLVTQPFDVLPTSDVDRVRRLLKEVR